MYNSLPKKFEKNGLIIWVQPHFFWEDSRDYPVYNVYILDKDLQRHQYVIGLQEREGFLYSYATGCSTEPNTWPGGGKIREGVKEEFAAETAMKAMERGIIQI